jgi:hypothetical protein
MFASVRALGAYVATVSRRDVLANFQLLSGIAAPSKTEFSRLAATCTRATSAADQGSLFVALDISGPLKLVVFIDAGFYTKADHRSQIGYIIALALEDQTTKLTPLRTHRKDVGGRLVMFLHQSQLHL